MKKIFFAALSFIVLQANAQDEKTYNSKKDKKKFYSDLISKYGSSDVKCIWKSDEEKEEFVTWVDGNKESELIDDFETVIHELFHGVCKMTDKGQLYFISKDIIIDVPITEVFNSKELNSFVRKGQQDSIFRYGLYVGGKNEIPTGGKTNLINTNSRNEASSIQDGLYGLIEEFSAYYFSTLSSLPLNEYFKTKFGMEDADAWYDYRHMVEGTIVAYYEFHFFMSKYLLFAKQQHPKIYQSLKDNKSIRVVYTLIENRFRKVISMYNDLLLEIPQNSANDMMESLDFSGSDADIAFFALMAGIPKEQIYDGDKIILPKEYKDALLPEYRKFEKEVKDQIGNDIFFFYASPTKQFNYLSKQITREMDTELNNFMLEGCDDSTYKSFLK